MMSDGVHCTMTLHAMSCLHSFCHGGLTVIIMRQACKTSGFMLQCKYMGLVLQDVAVHALVHALMLALLPDVPLFRVPRP